MREILFRGKDRNGVWKEGYYCRLHETTHAFVEAKTAPVPIFHYIACDEMTDFELQDKFRFYEVDPETVCEYTGFKDVTGRRIFENDVVEFEDNERGAECRYRGDVYWDDEFCQFYMSNTISKEPHEVFQNCMVVGNLIDDPDIVMGCIGITKGER